MGKLLTLSFSSLRCSDELFQSGLMFTAIEKLVASLVSANITPFRLKLHFYAVSAFNPESDVMKRFTESIADIKDQSTYFKYKSQDRSSAPTRLDILIQCGK